MWARTSCCKPKYLQRSGLILTHTIESSGSKIPMDTLSLLLARMKRRKASVPSLPNAHLANLEDLTHPIHSFAG